MTSSFQYAETAGAGQRAFANYTAPKAAAMNAVPTLQRKQPEDEELQMKSIREDALLQKKENPATPKVNKTGMPDNLKTGIENLSGFSMDDVKVHYNSEKPAQLNALAYAQGTNIHIAPGQERHLPHEAWHIVQQKQGRVQATIQAKGVAINDDKGLETEADVMGESAVLNVPDEVENIIQGKPQKMNSSRPKRNEALTFQRIINNNLQKDKFPIQRKDGDDVDIVQDREQTYANSQDKEYENELRIYVEWRAQNLEAESAYSSGRIFTYREDTSDIIHQMLNHGQVMYVYDENLSLRVSGSNAVIKHAILGKNNKVYAAGIAYLDDPGKNKLAEAIKLAKDRDQAQSDLLGFKKGSKNEIKRKKKEITDYKKDIKALGEKSSVSVKDLTKRYNDYNVRKSNSTLHVNEDSGHYRPEYGSGHRALEGWRSAGYKRINWEPRHRRPVEDPKRKVIDIADV